MLATLHELVMVETGKSDMETDRKIKKPICIIQYNKNMGAVDQVDISTGDNTMVQEVVFPFI